VLNILNSKEFEERLQLNNFSELETEFQKTKNFFEHLNEKIKCDEVSLRFPAFCLWEQEIRIKFPTFKIRIINHKKSHSELQELLKDVGIYSIYEETNVVKLPGLNPVQSTAIHCLEVGLDRNIRTADKIEELLNDNQIQTQRCVDSGHYLIPIKVDEEGYIKIIQK